MTRWCTERTDRNERERKSKRVKRIEKIGSRKRKIVLLEELACLKKSLVGVAWRGAQCSCSENTLCGWCTGLSSKRGMREGSQRADGSGPPVSSALREPSLLMAMEVPQHLKRILASSPTSTVR